MKPLVIYHANCTDGFGAAFAAWLKLGDEAEYRACHYNQDCFQDGETVHNREVYILDFSFPRDVMDWLFRDTKRVVWLDHHKTAFETWLGSLPQHGQYVLGTEHTIWLDNNKSGAMLAWEYFHPGTEIPMLIQHIDDRDRWQFKLDGSKELHATLASLKPWTFEQWDAILAETSYRATDGTGIDSFYDDGTVLLRAHSQQVQSALKQAMECRIREPQIKLKRGNSPFIRHVDVEGYQRQYFADGLAVNAPPFLASDLGHELANKSGTFGLVWLMAGDGRIHCSLRSNGDYDVSEIAKAFGGGGHRNAAGFSTDIDTLMGWIK
jgi:oligoribonuclease NrnB/cAMP/cGMP phosphodiesterase (DHH superfamily)